ncbi:Mss4-like protein [Podospora australis]|uniref:Mss4-like protein n=1 Tax=Podospora australis TaxID=1536484 RepID=A0AAN6X0X2_9PEZI|nr:Mss4-like protein [Podospora australis]
MSPLPFPTPKTITGGCLCGSIRYRVDFPPDHNFQTSSGTCQCTQCRKQTGGLFFVEHFISPASTAFSLTSSSDPSSTMKTYSASPIADRHFCGKCGSFLYWKAKDASQDGLYLAVGSIDEEFLVGENAYGEALVNGGGKHIWCENEIKGVTDGGRVELLGGKRGERVAGNPPQE